MDYMVTFEGRRKVGVKGVSCAAEAESVARAKHPDKMILDICRQAYVAETPVDAVRTYPRKKLPE